MPHHEQLTSTTSTALLSTDTLSAIPSLQQSVVSLVESEVQGILDETTKKMQSRSEDDKRAEDASTPSTVASALVTELRSVRMLQDEVAEEKRKLQFAEYALSEAATQDCYEDADRYLNCLD